MNCLFCVIVAPEILGKEIIDNNDFERIEKVGTKITLNVGTSSYLLLQGANWVQTTCFEICSFGMCCRFKDLCRFNNIFSRKKNHEHNFG